MTTTDPLFNRDTLQRMGLTPEQVDEALAQVAAGERRADPQRIQQLEADNGIPPLAHVCPQTAADLFMSLNGFDEIAIAQHFGAPVGELRADATTLARALAFVHMRRTGLPDKEAYREAMSLTIQTVSHDYFTPEPKADDAARAEGNDDGA